ncbi:hypothetical protein [Nocardia stercoris]|nr:hypothetical protein [Nocardia stercoris]
MGSNPLPLFGAGLAFFIFNSMSAQTPQPATPATTTTTTTSLG